MSTFGSFSVFMLIFSLCVYFYTISVSLFLVISCAPVQNEKKINFSKDLTFEEFKSNLKVYADNSDYPNIDE